MPRHDVTIFNVSADEPGGSNLIVQLAGAQAIGASSAVSAQNPVSNPIDVNLTGAGATAEAGTPSNTSDWPAHWPQARGMYAISDRENVVSTYADWSFKSDLLIHQGTYPKTGNVNNGAAWLAAGLAINPNCKVGQHTLKQAARQPPGLTDRQKCLGSEVIANKGAEADWYAYDTSGNALWGSNDLKSDRFVNPAYHLTPTYGGENYAEAYADLWFTKFSANDDMVQYHSGVYFDSTDLNDTKPSYLVGENGPTLSGKPDYNADGNSNDTSTMYRLGSVEDVRAFKAASPNGDWWIASNGGRDGTQFSGSIVSNDWYQLWDCRVAENGDSKLGLEMVNNVYVTGFADMHARLLSTLRTLHINYKFCAPIGSNDLGRPYALFDMFVGQNGFVGMQESDFTADDWLLREFIWALCMSTEELMDGCLQQKGQPVPPLDLYVYDIGDPIGTRSIGTLSNTGTFTLRSDDDNGFFFTEFENGYSWVNLNPIDGNSTWPQSATDEATSLPSPPSGKVARRLNGNTYFNPKRGYGCRNQNPTMNNGGLVGSSITARRWTGGLVIWADS